MLRRLSLALCILGLLTSSALSRSSSLDAGKAQSFPVPPIRARAAVVMDAGTGAVLAAKYPHLHLPMASTTKIMTALLALEMGHLSDRIVVPRAAFDFESDATVMGLHPGQVVTLRDLLYGLLLPSGADAANTIAIHYGGSEARFAGLMNQEAARLGMRDTHYVNAHGLTAANHYSSAYDLAVLGQYVSHIPEIMKITATRTYRWDGHILTNVNHVLFWYPGVDGIKPGYTDEAGICQVLDVNRDGRHIIVTLLNTPDLEIDARNLLNFGLRDFTWIRSPLEGDTPTMLLSGQDRSGPYDYFVGSGHYIRGKLWWSAFISNGGLAALGFPRTEPLGAPRARIQYFQNGALSLSSTGHVRRLALGLTPLPTPPATPSPTPRTPTPTPMEATVGAARAADSGTATPAPPPGLIPTPTPTPTPHGPPATGKVFQSFQRAHARALGTAVSRLYLRYHFPLQVFAYGALVYDRATRTVYQLPLGDRFLGAHGYLPAHAGNVYPAGFALVALLRAIHWPPYGSR